MEAAEAAAEGRAAAWVVDWPFTGPIRAWSFLTVQTLPLECRRLPCAGSMDLTVEMNRRADLPRTFVPRRIRLQLIPF